MTADPRLLSKARRGLEQDAAAHRKRRALWREQLYADEPRLLKLDKAIKQVFLDAIVNPSPGAMDEAAVRSLALQRERAELLEKMGVSAGSLEETPFCPDCHDSGFIGKELCGCLLERYRALQSAELSSILDLQGQSFDSFNAELFSAVKNPLTNSSPRENIEVICELCFNFCRRFGKDSANLLFSGAPGTGKTFLSACVAGAVAANEFSVVYDTAVRQLAQMEALQFGRGGEDTEAAVQRLRGCDLLIIDDLGVEFLTPYTQTALWDLINTRLLSNKKMLISTNLSRDGLRSRYSPALDSRLQGEFLWLDFFGEDLRQRVRS
ncbi:MAG: ATP-binding protein [Oscillospiraceae bacterium]|nr:ATP-binding protein [Oscillospiraceae bacterium]